MSRREHLFILPLAAALFFVPLVYVRDVLDFVRWPKLFVLQVCLIGAFIGLLLARPHTRTGPFSLPVICFIGWSALSTLWAFNIVDAMVHLNGLVTVGLVFYIGSAVEHEQKRNLVLVWSMSAGIVSIIGIGQYFGFDPLVVPTAGNPSSTFGYRNYVATYLAITIPVNVGFALFERSQLRRTLLLLSAMVTTLLLLYTRTRGAWVGLVGALAIGAFLVTRSPELRREVLAFRGKAIAIPLLVLLLLLAPLTPNMTRPGDFRFDERKADLKTTAAQVFSPSGARGRLTVWRNTLSMVADHPLVGVGLGAWMLHYPEYDGGEWITVNVAPQRPHNDFLWVLSETGLVGLSLFAWIVVRLFLRGWRAKNLADLALCAGAIAYLGHSTFSFPRERIAAPLVFWLAVGLLSEHDERSHRPALAAGGLALLCLGLIFTYRCIAFDRHFARTANAWQRQDWASVVRDSRAALAYGVLNFRVLQLNGLGNERLGNFEEAERAFERSLLYHPNEGHLPLAQVRERRGDLDRAVEAYRNELSLFPASEAAQDGLVRVLGALGSEARARGDWAGAVGAYEEALALTPLDAGTHNRVGEAALGMGRLNRAIGAFTRASELDRTHPRYPNNLGAALAQGGRSEEAEAAYRLSIDADKTYARAYQNLGDLLLARGDTLGATSAYRSFTHHWLGDAAFIAQTEALLKTLTRPGK